MVALLNLHTFSSLGQVSANKKNKLYTDVQWKLLIHVIGTSHLNLTIFFYLIYCIIVKACNSHVFLRDLLGRKFSDVTDNMIEELSFRYRWKIMIICWILKVKVKTNYLQPKTSVRGEYKTRKGVIGLNYNTVYRVNGKHLWYMSNCREIFVLIFQYELRQPKSFAGKTHLSLENIWLPLFQMYLTCWWSKYRNLISSWK